MQSEKTARQRAKPPKVPAALRAHKNVHDGNGAAAVAVVDVIRDRILDLTLAPGARIDDRLLMEQFGLGRTPAREAFNRLAAEGFILIQRNKGATVRPLDIAQIAQFFDAYGASERLVGFFCQIREAGLVADLHAVEDQYEEADAAARYLDMTRLNAEFHRRIARASDNEYVFDFANRLYNHARRLSYFIYLSHGDGDSKLAEMQRSITTHHRGIIDTIVAQDNQALIAELGAHAQYFHHWVIRAIGTTRGLVAPLPPRR